MGQHISSLFAGRDDMLQPWHNVTARGVRAARQGRLMLALVSHQQALRIAQDLLAMPTAQRADRADDCVAALVVSFHNLAELQSDAGGTDLAAAQLARAHEVLMRLLCDPSVCRALRRAALRHSHVTHAGLLRYLHEYGPHPAITRALRAGCLSVATGSPTLH
jgi:hypothetical protein